jgi:hypothetical protein
MPPTEQVFLQLAPLGASPKKLNPKVRARTAVMDKPLMNSPHGFIFAIGVMHSRQRHMSSRFKSHQI